MKQKAILALGLTMSLLHSVIAQDCTPEYNFVPVTGINSIEWDKFPEFALPFTIIYNGPRFGDQNSRPLKHGFSHLAAFSGNEGNTLPVANRALLWNSVAALDDTQPWSNLTTRSPWGNDMTRYRTHWDSYLSALANGFSDSYGTGVPKADIICLDVERMQLLDRDILQLKENRLVPETYLSLSDAAFLETYKRDIRGLYGSAVDYLETKGVSSGTKVSSYSDIPVRNTWLNVTSNSWTDWTTNAARTHYLAQDNSGKIGGDFFGKLDFQAPSPYYYYPYDNPLGKDYLSYLLFQIEVNRAWSDKPVIPFVWMRHHDQYVANSPQIPTFIAEATAIFPFFSGAKGLWLWDNNSFEFTRQENYQSYEYFINGLYRLSRFSDFFTGNYELVIETSARDLMEQQTPVWRGVAKDGRILIAAQNPYATDEQETKLNVRHQGWQRVITLKGREIHLCSYDLNEVKSAISEAVLYANPTRNQVNLRIGISGQEEKVDYTLFDYQGRQVTSGSFFAPAGISVHRLPLPDLSPGVYVARFSTQGSSTTRKLIIE